MELNSIKRVPIETLIALRKRFSKLLSEREHYHKPTHSIMLSDIELFTILASCKITHGKEESTAKSSYSALQQAHNYELSFEETLEKGWIRISLGRVYFVAPRDALRYDNADSKRLKVLRSFQASLYKVDYELPAHTSQQFPHVAAHLAGSNEGISIGSPSPHWVAARLWDECVEKHAGDVMWWVDRVGNLGVDEFIPENYWIEESINTFIEAAVHLLEREGSALTWQAAEALAHKISLINRKEDPEAFTSQMPTSIIDKFEWLYRRDNEAFLYESLYNSPNLYLPIRLLINHAISGFPAKDKRCLTERLFELAFNRPEIFDILINSSKRDPKFVADFVMSTKLSSLACFLISQWELGASAWDREVLEAKALEDKVDAFADALDVLIFFINKGDIPPEDFSSLLAVLRSEASSFTWIKARPANASNDILGYALDTLPKVDKGFLLSVVKIYGKDPQYLLIGNPFFSCALDIISKIGIGDKIDPDLFATAYINSLKDPLYHIPTAGIDMDSAATLIEFGMRSEENLKFNFLNPYNIAESLSKAETTPREAYSILDKLCQAMRTHIRILCRASSYLGASTPPEIIASLISTIHAGATDDKNNHRVCAFTSRYEEPGVFGSRDIPISHDLAIALRALPAEGAQALMEKILLINEPLVLAQLYVDVPVHFRQVLEDRINTLTPENAPPAWSITEVDARIAALLEAGITTAAESFIEDSKGLRTIGKLNDRELKSLRRTLNLAFLKKDWVEIRKSWSLEEFSGENKRHADEIILFFKGLVELQAADGDSKKAIQAFDELSKRNSKNTAYKVNLLASKIGDILEKDAFTILPPQKYRYAATLLSEADSLLNELSDKREKDIINTNKAILLLSIGKNNDAFQILAGTPSHENEPSFLAYSAIALFRMGHEERAHAILDHKRFLDDPESIVTAALEHINGRNQSKGSIIFQMDATEINASRNAFNLLNSMSPTDQIKVVKGMPLIAYITETVRLASRALVSLVPMTTFLSISDCEDDLNALLEKIIESRISFLGWSTADQSRGGYSAKGNPGERDIVIKKDGAELSIIEALICDKPASSQVTLNNLSSHLQKLFGYGDCWIPIHLTYSFNKDGVLPILECLKKMCAEDVPNGIQYRLQEGLPPDNSLPQGFLAKYERDGLVIPMLFLVLDLSQSVQKEASKLAGATKVRSSPKRQTKKDPLE